MNEKDRRIWRHRTQDLIVEGHVRVHVWNRHPKQRSVPAEVKTDTVNCRPIRAPTTRWKNYFEVICLKISSHMHHAFNNSEVLTQSVHIPTCFSVATTTTIREFTNSAVRTVRIVMHWKETHIASFIMWNLVDPRCDFEGFLQQVLSLHTHSG